MEVISDKLVIDNCWSQKCWDITFFQWEIKLTVQTCIRPNVEKLAGFVNGRSTVKYIDNLPLETKPD